MILDLLLAILHHLLAFGLFAVLAVELVWTKGAIDHPGLRRLAWLDGLYGGLAGGILVIGLLRVFFGAKGWEYYAASPSFWAKMAAFAAVGLLSIVPTRRILGWRRRAAREPGFLPPAEEVARTRRFLHIEAGIFLLIPIFAAAMARGY